MLRKEERGGLSDLGQGLVKLRLRRASEGFKEGV